MKTSSTNAKYAVVNSIFQGGGICSRHRTLAGALKSLRGWTHTYDHSTCMWEWNGNLAGEGIVSTDPDTGEAAIVDMIGTTGEVQIFSADVCQSRWRVGGSERHYSAPYLAGDEI